MVPGVNIGITGFLLLAFVQIGRAGVDTAEYSQQMLQISREQLEVSRQGLKAEQKAPKRFEAIKNQGTPTTGFQQADFADDAEKPENTGSPSEAALPVPEIREGETILYQGQAITQKNGVYITGGETFNRLLFAKSHIERSSNKVTRSGPAVDPVDSQKPLRLSGAKTVEAANPKAALANDPMQYKGKTIVELNGQFLCNGIPFKTLQAAQKYVDDFVSSPIKPLPGAWKP